MKLVVGSRGNFKSTQAIIEKTEGRIAEIYLSVSNSRFGSGRNYVHEVQAPEIARQVKLAAKYGIDISLAFNTVCFGLDRFNGEFQANFLETARELMDAGVDRIILSDPYIMELIRDNVPGMKIIVSVFSEVDSLNRLKFYRDLGVDRIIIPHELNRDMEKLKSFRENFPGGLEVITNLGCSHYCARGDIHSMFTGHYTGEMRKKVMGDCYTAYCNRYKLNHPLDFLTQDWIRPEDIHRYEEIGIEYFKVAGRATSTSWIINAANAYLDRSYDGNIFNLLSTYYPFTDRMPGEKTPFNIPNKELDSIMDRLYQCGHMCESCGACGEDMEKLLGI